MHRAADTPYIRLWSEDGSSSYIYTKATIASLERASFALFFDANNSIFCFCAEMYLFPEQVIYSFFFYNKELKLYKLSLFSRHLYFLSLPPSLPPFLPPSLLLPFSLKTDITRAHISNGSGNSIRHTAAY